MTPLSAGSFACQTGVSRETMARLETYLNLLAHWQQRLNLVGASTLKDPWRRHVLDSAQLVPLLPHRSGTVVDLGSGAGLPGLILAILGVEDVHLVESDQRKAAFLREAARLTKTSVRLHVTRIESLPLKASVITARALAPLPRLLALSDNLRGPETVCLFLKGNSAEDELTEARKDWTMETEAFTSQTDPSGIVLKLWGIGRASHR